MLPPKKPIEKEAVRLLAIEIGCRPAARKLGLNQNTVVQWSRRFGWFKQPKLPPTHNDSKAVISVIKPGDALLETHKELEAKTKTALMQTVAKAAQLAARKPAFDVSTTAQIRDLALTMAKLCGSPFLSGENPSGPLRPGNQVSRNIMPGVSALIRKRYTNGSTT